MAKEKTNIITNAKLKKYFSVTEKAFSIAKKNIAKTKESEAREILNMVDCYLQDAKWFEKQGNLVNSFAALNYAHGWLDSGSRLGIFDVKDNKLFVIK
ncbi:MAG: DUF357 domain-containing protein [Candidatus Pacearchaeota archaeon]|nr:DUF357 domain-containing protein [Candidatus Pacearchaeota archaeon]